MWEATVLSLRVLAVAVPVIFVTGIALALLFARRRFPGKLLLETLVMLPLVLPPSVVGYALLRFLGRGGPIVEWFDTNILFTWQAAAVAAAIVGMPLMVQAARIGIEGVDRAIEDAARLDGASHLHVILAMTLPLARRGIFTGLALATARALGEFGATLAVAGSIPGRTQTIPLAVYDAMQRGDYETANILSMITVALGFVTIFFTRQLAERGETNT
ncbi:MAG: molybdate ABC transporter permease subunit [Thermomicrobiales bacterium]